MPMVLAYVGKTRGTDHGPRERKRLEIRRIERPCGTVPHQGAEI
jgi:hypothetical protein